MHTRDLRVFFPQRFYEMIKAWPSYLYRIDVIVNAILDKLDRDRNNRVLLETLGQLWVSWSFSYVVCVFAHQFAEIFSFLCWISFDVIQIFYWLSFYWGQVIGCKELDLSPVFDRHFHILCFKWVSSVWFTAVFYVPTNTL